MCAQALLTIPTTKKKGKKLSSENSSNGFVHFTTFFRIVENGYLQHAGAERLGHPNPGCHDYIVFKDINLLDAVEFRNGTNFAI